MAMTNLILFFHILAALWLAGGSFAGAVVRAQTRRANDLSAKVFGLRLGVRLGKIYITPGAIVAGLIGFYLVTARGFTFATAWVQASAVLYLLMLGISLFYLMPRLGRTLAAAEASLAAGQPNAELLRLSGAKLPGILADVNSLGIVVLTFLMAVKPGA